jgi:hypothetical protein
VLTFGQLKKGHGKVVSRQRNEPKLTPLLNVGLRDKWMYLCPIKGPGAIRGLFLSGTNCLPAVLIFGSVAWSCLDG